MIRPIVQLDYGYSYAGYISFPFHIHLLLLDCLYALMIAGTGLTLSLVSGALSHFVPLKSGCPNPPGGASSLASSFNNPMTPSNPSIPSIFCPLNLLLRILVTASCEIPNLRERKARENRSGSRVCRARRPAMAENVSFLVGCHGPWGLCATASGKLGVCGVCCGVGADEDGSVCTGWDGGRSRGRCLAFLDLGGFGRASGASTFSFGAFSPITPPLAPLAVPENLSLGESCLQHPMEDELKPRATPGQSTHTVLCSLDPNEDEAARHEAIVNDFFCGIYRRVQIFWNAKMKSGGFVIDFFFFWHSFFMAISGTTG